MTDTTAISDLPAVPGNNITLEMKETPKKSTGGAPPLGNFPPPWNTPKATTVRRCQ